MTDEQIQKKLDQIQKLANELDDEAKARYGHSGNIFLDAEGGIHMMDGDEDEGIYERQSHIKFSCKGICRMGAGAW